MTEDATTEPGAPIGAHPETIEAAVDIHVTETGRLKARVSYPPHPHPHPTQVSMLVAVGFDPAAPDKFSLTAPTPAHYVGAPLRFALRGEELPHEVMRVNSDESDADYPGSSRVSAAVRSVFLAIGEEAAAVAAVHAPPLLSCFDDDRAAAAAVADPRLVPHLTEAARALLPRALAETYPAL